MFNFVLFFPLIFMQLYLTGTLAFFMFGPIDFNIPNAGYFWVFIFLYHMAFCVGYIIAFITRKNAKYTSKNDFEIAGNSSLLLFNVVLYLSVIASLMSFKGQSTFLDLVNPIFWFETALHGLINPGEAYVAKMERVEIHSSGNKVFHILLFFIAFSKTIIVPFVVFYWHRLSFLKKTFGLFITLLPVFSSLSNGTNKGVFDFVILYSTSLIVFFFYNKFNFGSFGFGKRKFFLFAVFLSFFGALIFFGSSMSQRGGDIRFIETQDYLNNIKVNQSSVIKSQNDSFYFTYAWLGSYIVQGYYGFALAIDQEFESTFGVGNSTFLTRNVESIFGIELRERTFQNKIHKWWSETSQWHTFYSHFANDFHFIGVVFVCFFISYFLGRVWFSFLATGSVFAGALMTIFAILIIFIPANNQVFGFLDGFSAFFWSSLLWSINRGKSSVTLR